MMESLQINVHPADGNEPSYRSFEVSTRIEQLQEQLDSSGCLAEMLTHQLEQNCIQRVTLSNEIERLKTGARKLSTQSTELNHVNRAINTLELQIASLEQFSDMLKDELDEELLIKSHLKDQIAEFDSNLTILKSPLRRPSTPNVIKRNISLEFIGNGSRPGTPSLSRSDPFDGYKAHHIKRLEHLKAAINPNNDIESVQTEITETFISIIRDVAVRAETKIGKSPCKYAIFVGGSVGRREPTIYSDVEFGIVVEKKDFAEYFINLGSFIATHLDEVGIECDENFSPPHLIKGKQEFFRKDWRGVYFFPKSEDEPLTKKGSNLLIDTPENFASWQQLKAKVAGSAVLASILRESKFIHGDEILYKKFYDLSWHALRISKETRREFFNVYLSSLKQLQNKLPILKHVDNAIFMETFPVTYDIKDIMKCLYSLIAGISLAGNIEETNPIQRLISCKEKNIAPTLVDKLMIHYKFLYSLRIEIQAHYKAAYHLVNGLQIFSGDLRNHKKKFLDANGALKPTTIEWYRRTLFTVRSQLKESSTLSEKSVKKLAKLWSTLNNSVPESVTEKTLSKLEIQIKKMESSFDKNKYFIAYDADAISSKTKPMTLGEISTIKGKINAFKASIKSFYGEFYENCNEDEHPIVMPSFMSLESDLQEIENLAPTIKSKIELNPFILSTSQVQQLKECIAFIKASVDIFPTVPCV